MHREHAEYSAAVPDADFTVRVRIGPVVGCSERHPSPHNGV